MIRIAGIVSLISVLLIQSLSTSLILFHFKINQVEIATELCENKTKPEMHCEGKCYLEKQIKADEESHADDQQLRVEFLSLIFTFKDLVSEIVPATPLKVKQEFPYIVSNISNGIKPIFHPPRF